MRVKWVSISCFMKTNPTINTWSRYTIKAGAFTIFLPDFQGKGFAIFAFFPAGIWETAFVIRYVGSTKTTNHNSETKKIY